MQPALRRTTVRVGLLVLLVVAALTVAELASEPFREFTGSHSLIATFMTEAVLLVGVYLVIDELIQRRERRRWSDVMSLGIRALSTSAEAPAAVVRRAVDGLLGGTGDPAVPRDYRDLVAARADELAGWLLADPARARSFAQEARQSASRLEEAIVRWGPTLVEDPDSAELLNLLPDIVDSARAAADVIAGTGPREGFRDTLLEILANAQEFRVRVTQP